MKVGGRGVDHSARTGSWSSMAAVRGRGECRGVGRERLLEGEVVERLGRGHPEDGGGDVRRGLVRGGSWHGKGGRGSGCCGRRADHRGFGDATWVSQTGETTGGQRRLRTTTRARTAPRHTSRFVCSSRGGRGRNESQAPQRRMSGKHGERVVSVARRACVHRGKRSSRPIMTSRSARQSCSPAKCLSIHSHPRSGPCYGILLKS